MTAQSAQPLKIIVWGPGSLGSVCIRAALERPDLELVGVLGYSADKVGQDAGTYVGLPPAGVTITDDIEAVLALDADCVLHTVKVPVDPEAMHSDVLRMLSSGKNVISSAGYHFLPKHDDAHVQRFVDACRTGGSSLHGTGENPGFMLERLGVALAGASGGVRLIRLREFTDLTAAGSSASDYQVVGFGLPTEVISADLPGVSVWKEFFHGESLTYVCEKLFGRRPDRIDQVMRGLPSPRDFHYDGVVFAEGTVGHIQMIMSAIIDDRIVAESEINWFLGEENAPLAYDANDHWIVEIEGELCSFRLDLDAFASLEDNTVFRDGEAKSPIMYATASVMLGALPVVTQAPPGLVTPAAWNDAAFG